MQRSGRGVGHDAQRVPLGLRVAPVGLLVLGLWLSAEAAAHTEHVPGDFSTIQAGIDAAASGDTVLVEDGSYAGAGNRNLDFFGKNLVLRASAGAAATVIDCQASAGSPARGIHLHSGETNAAVIEGFTIRNGYAPDHGGGILCEGASPRIAGCVLTDNATGMSGDGAGIACLSSAAVLEGCVLVANVANLGAGGGMLCSNSAVALRDCVFEANHATWGGGLYCQGSSGVDLLRCVFIANEATFDGGATFDTFSAATIRSCTFAFNAATAADRATGFGVSQNSAVSVEATILAFGPSGRAVYCDPGSTATLECCDLFQNAGGDWVGCVGSQLGENGNFTANPYFCNPGSNDLSLRNDSPCLPGQHPDGTACGLIGAFGLGPCVSALHPATWSGVKSLYR